MKKLLIPIGVIVIVLLIGVIGLLVISRPEGSSKVPFIVSQKEKTYNMEKLLSSVKAKFPTVTVTKVYTEANDPNGDLGKPGNYIQGGVFADSRIADCDTTASDWGMECGGSIEVFQNETDAKKRVEYLANFQTGILSAGSAKQVGRVVVRASDDLVKSNQDELTTYIQSQL